MIKYKQTGKGYRFWFARVDAELPTKKNSWTTNKVVGLKTIKEWKL